MHKMLVDFRLYVYVRRSQHKVTGIQGIWTQIALQRIFIGTEPAIMP